MTLNGWRPNISAKIQRIISAPLYIIQYMKCRNSSGNVMKKSVRPQKWSPRTNFGSQNWSPLPMSVPHENVLLQPSKVAS